MSRLAVIIVLLINIVSCFIFRVFIHRGRMNIYDFSAEENQAPKEASILIAGLANQPYSAFRELGKSVSASRMIYAEYSCFGWNARNSAAQLDCLKYDRNTLVSVYAISVGDKIARRLNRCQNIYSINPCPHPSVLKDKFQRILPVVSFVSEALVFLLGWIATIPFIPTEENVRYSLALLADQLWEISVRRDTPPGNRGITSVIFSTYDEYIVPTRVMKFYKCPTIPYVTIDSKHARTSDLTWSKDYNNAIMALKERRKNYVTD